MLELTLRVGAADVEEVLDVVLPALPGGVHLREAGEVVELKFLGGPEWPGDERLRALAGSRLVDLTSAQVSEDWRERRLSRYSPLVVAERLLVRPDWAPPSADPSLIEIVLGESAAFGTAIHPTTQACLAMLAEADPGGSLADYGCGSGVLSIAAAKLGWSPIVAVDVNEPSLSATRANAARNAVEVDARRVDLADEPPPPAETIVANVPPDVHVAMARQLAEPPARLIASGFKPEDGAAVAEAWSEHGLRITDEVRANDWSALAMQ